MSSKMMSVDETAIKRLWSLSECCICLSTYNDPRILSCCHTLCLKCLEDIQSKNKKKPGDSLPCPLCRNEFTIPPGGMSDLRKNFFIESLIEMTKVLNSDNKSVPCSSCSLVDDGNEIPVATMRCLNCYENYCSRCSKSHQGQKLTKDHKIVKVDSTLNDEEIRNRFPARYCEKHFDKVLDYYCSDCITVVCVSCFVEDHQSHKCKDVKSVDKDFRKTIEENCIIISDYSKQMAPKKFEMEREKKEFLAKILETENAIMNKSKQMKALIDQHSENLLTELSVMKQNHQKVFETDIEEIERRMTVLESFVLYCTELKSKGSPSEVCGSVYRLITRAKELSEENNNYLSCSNKLVEVEFIATDQNALLQYVNNIIGKLSDSVKQFENCAIVIGSNTGDLISDDVIKINLTRPEEVSNLKPIPTQMRVESAAAVYCNSIFVTGIGDNWDEIWKFDSTSLSWKKCTSLIPGRRRHSVAFVDQVLHICGGYDNSNQSTLDDVQAYNTITNKCKTVGKLRYPVRSSGNCVPFRDSLYIFGGMDVKSKDFHSVQVYDTKSNTCSLLSSPMPRADRLLRAVLWENTVMLFSCDSCFVYNFDTEIWQVKDRFKINVSHFGLTAKNGKIYVAGGGRRVTDTKGVVKWDMRDDVRYVPLANILNDEPIEWKHHAFLPRPAMIDAFTEMSTNLGKID